MNIKKKRRGKSVEEVTEREILRKQMELLAEATATEKYGPYLRGYSKEMVRIHKELNKPIFALSIGMVLLAIATRLQGTKTRNRRKLRKRWFS